MLGGRAAPEPVGGDFHAPPALDVARLPLRGFGGNPAYEVPGGWIVHDVVRNSLDAHCACDRHRNPSNPCRLNRTADRRGGNNGARGRPLGLLLAWLRAGPARATRELHHKMVNKKLCQPHDIDDVSLAKRQEARQWLKDNGFDALLGRERPRLPDEPEEPEGLA